MGRARYQLFLVNSSYAVIVLALCVFLGPTGCADKRQEAVKGKLDYAELHNATIAEARNLERYRDRQSRLEKTAPPPPVDLEPMEPEYSPLDEVRLSIDMKDTTLHDALYVVARHAGLNLVIDPEIPRQGNLVTISFDYATTSEVLESLLGAYDYSWGVKRNVIFVKATEERAFDLDFLNVKTGLDIDSGGDIYGSSRSETDESNELSGNFSVSASLGRGVEAGSLYSYIEQNVRSILNSTSSTPSGGATTGTDKGGGDSAEDSGEASTAGTAGSTTDYFYIDPIAGSLYVRATPRKVQAVAQLIDRLKGKMTRQVVIDARILEVTLSDEFYLGVDWNWLLNRVVNSSTYNIDITTNQNTGNSLLPDTDNNRPVPGVFALNYTESITGSDGVVTEVTNSVVQALQRFGGLKTIANPHVRARHAQPALITSGRTEAYLKEITRESEINDGVQEITYTTETAKAFSGVMLGVFPFIKGDEVDLQIFPIRSSVDLTNEVNVGENNDIFITLPKVDVQNVHTSLHVRDGDTVIIGGLIDKSQDNNDDGSPGLMSLPLIGNLFQHKRHLESIRELVIIMNIRLI